MLTFGACNVGIGPIWGTNVCCSCGIFGIWTWLAFVVVVGWLGIVPALFIAVAFPGPLVYVSCFRL